MLRGEFPKDSFVRVKFPKLLPYSNRFLLQLFKSSLAVPAQKYAIVAITYAYNSEKLPPKTICSIAGLALVVLALYRNKSFSEKYDLNPRKAQIMTLAGLIVGVMISNQIFS